MSGVSEWKTGWRALVGGFLGAAIGVHALPIYTQGLFVVPLQQAFGWTRLEISAGGSLLVILLAVASVPAGALADRMDLRRLICGSAFFLGCAFVALSRAGPGLASFYLPFAAMAVLGASCSTLSVSTVVARHFQRHRGAAFGVMLTGTGVSGAVAPILLGDLIARDGWQAGYLAIAAVMFVAIVPLWLLIGPSPPPEQSEKAATAGRGTMVAVLRRPRTWKMVVTFLAIPLAASGLMVHLVPMLTDAGVPAATAARYLALIGLAVIVTRLAVGVAVDRFFAPHVAALALTVCSAGLASLAWFGASAGAPAALAIGAAIGMEFDLVGYLTSRYYPPEMFGRVYGIFYSACLVGVAASPIVYASVQAWSGSYQPALLGAAALLLLTAGLFVTMDRYET